MEVGVEWLVDARGCAPERLRDARRIRAVLQRIIDALELRTIGDAIVHTFPEAGGVTALWMLTESHLACHTYPERSVATFNLYCCRPRARFDWAGELRELLGARDVTVRVEPRGGAET